MEKPINFISASIIVENIKAGEAITIVDERGGTLHHSTFTQAQDNTRFSISAAFDEEVGFKVKRYLPKKEETDAEKVKRLEAGLKKACCDLYREVPCGRCPLNKPSCDCTGNCTESLFNYYIKGGKND